MSELVKICPTSGVADNSVKSFEVGTNVIAIYNVGGTFYATDNECTHGAASLADGILEDDIIECSLHFGAFNVRTGAADLQGRGAGRPGDGRSGQDRGGLERAATAHSSTTPADLMTLVHLSVS